MTVEEYRKWDFHFIELAKHIANWSKDPSTKVGAVIADSRHVIRGIGYNGFPRGVKDSPERYNNRELKYKYVVHAELNAILNANGSVDGCTIYVYPTIMEPNVCPECCKSIIQSGIVEVVGLQGTTLSRWQDMAHISESMLREAGVRVRMI